MTGRRINANYNSPMCHGDHWGADPFEICSRQEVVDDVRRALNSLDLKYMLVLRGRYGLDGKAKTLGEVGIRLDVGGERIRQMQDKLTKNVLPKNHYIKRAVRAEGLSE
jgi:DNA-directed RNA polymerase sigma subunit (sigma70/sigma32)